MLVKYSWLTVKNVKVHSFNFKVTKWSGFFLLGFIPLYVWVEDYDYSK